MNKTQLNRLIDSISSNYSDEEIKVADVLSAISCRISEERIKRRLSQKAFAKAAGVTQQMVSKWENGDYNFTITSLIKISCTLGITLTDLLGEKNDDYSEPSIISQSSECSNFNILNIFCKSANDNLPTKFDNSYEEGAKAS